MRQLLPLLHPEPDRRRPDAELQPQGARGPARLPAPDAPGPRRADQRRRRPDPRARSCSSRSCAACARSPTSRSSGSARRVPVFLPQRIDDELCEMLEQYHPLWINLHFNHPNEITPEVSRAVDKLTRAGLPVGNQSVLLAGRQRLRPHPAGARPQAGREPDPALLPLPVRPGRGLGPLPDAGRQGPRDHGRPARPHQRLRRPDLRDRRARRRRQDPGHAQLPDQLLGPQGRAAQLRGLHHDLRGAADLPAARPGAPAATASTSGRSPARSGVLGPARGRADVDRAEGLRARSTPAATPRRTASRIPPSGCRSASARSRARRAAPSG